MHGSCRPPRNCGTRLARQHPMKAALSGQIPGGGVSWLARPWMKSAIGDRIGRKRG
jgi:hypothetical protein